MNLDNMDTSTAITKKEELERGKLLLSIQIYRISNIHKRLFNGKGGKMLTQQQFFFI